MRFWACFASRYLCSSILDLSARLVLPVVPPSWDDKRVRSFLSSSWFPSFVPLSDCSNPDDSRAGFSSSFAGPSGLKSKLDPAWSVYGLI